MIFARRFFGGSGPNKYRRTSDASLWITVSCLQSRTSPSFVFIVVCVLQVFSFRLGSVEIRLFASRVSESSMGETPSDVTTIQNRDAETHSYVTSLCLTKGSWKNSRKRSYQSPNLYRSWFVANALRLIEGGRRHASSVATPFSHLISSRVGSVEIRVFVST